MVSQEVLDEVGGYLRGYSAKHSLVEVIDRVSATLDELEAVVAPMTPEQAAFSPSPDAWSSQEVAGHIAEYSPAVTKLVMLLDRGADGQYYRQPNMPPERPISDMTVQDGAAVASDGLKEIASAFEAREPNLERTFAHPFFGQLNAREWVLFLRVHAIDHMNQIRANMSHADYPG